MYWMRDCHFCDKLKLEIKNLPSEYKKPIMIEYANIPMVQKAKHGIRLYPSIVFLSDDNKVLEKIEGYKPINEIVNIYAKVDNLENILQV